jgi:hypothetical protein
MPQSSVKTFNVVSFLGINPLGPNQLSELGLSYLRME